MRFLSRPTKLLVLLAGLALAMLLPSTSLAASGHVPAGGASVELDQAAYTAHENQGTLTITIVRDGDLPPGRSTSATGSSSRTPAERDRLLGGGEPLHHDPRGPFRASASRSRSSTRGSTRRRSTRSPTCTGQTPTRSAPTTTRSSRSSTTTRSRRATRRTRSACRLPTRQPARWAPVLRRPRAPPPAEGAPLRRVATRHGRRCWATSPPSPEPTVSICGTWAPTSRAKSPTTSSRPRSRSPARP